jgi:hypothetical protein
VDKKVKCLITENIRIDLSCKLCDKIYKRLDGLREHIKNVNEKQSDIQCPECDFVSKDYLEVRRHRKYEHNFGLGVCGKQCSSQVGFDHHVENTHGNGSFPCENCEEIYKTKRNILRRYLFVMSVELNFTIHFLLRSTRSAMEWSIPSHAISVTRYAGIKIN